MIYFTKVSSRGFAIAVLVTIVTAAAAQQTGQQRPPAPRQALPTPAAPAAPGSAQPSDAPQRTTATYGDWVLQCVENTAPPSEQICDIEQVTQVQGKNVPFSRVAVTHADKSQPVKLIVQVPVNASFAKDVHIQAADDDPGVIAPFANCTPNGCFSEFQLKDDILKKLRTASGVGKLSFADAGGHDVTVPLSFNGFGAAFDTLMKK
jgi:invasion protein IalB